MSMSYYIDQVFRRTLIFFCIFTLGIVIVILLPSVASANVITERPATHYLDEQCSETFRNRSGVWGTAYFAPRDVTVSSNGTATVRIYNYLCNGSSSPIDGNQVYFGANSIEGVGGSSGVLDFGGSGLGSQGAYRTLLMVDPNNGSDFLPAGGRLIKSFPVTISGNSFRMGRATYTIAIDGYGEVWQGGSFGRTNNSTTRLRLTVTVVPPTPAPTRQILRSIDSINCQFIQGWAFDTFHPNRNIEIMVYAGNFRGAGGQLVARQLTSISRPDVNATLPGYNFGGKTTHGYKIDIGEYTGRVAGGQKFYVYGKYHDRNTYVYFGMRQESPPCVGGSFESVSCVSIRGWAMDIGRPSENITIEVWANGSRNATGAQLVYSGPTNALRNDVASRYGEQYENVASNHGFDINTLIIGGVGVTIRDFVGSNTVEFRVYAVPGYGKPVVQVGPMRQVAGCDSSAGVSCGISVNPPRPEANQNFAVTVTAQGLNGQEAFVRIQIVGQGVDREGIIPVGSSAVVFEGISIQNTGSYSINAFINEMVSCTQSLAISDVPYVSAYGADVIARDIITRYNTSDNINSYANPPESGGSSAQFAAMAVSDITQFGSAKMRSIFPGPIKGLTFANNDSSSLFGGNFGGNLSLSSYFSQKPDDAALTASPIVGRTLNQGERQTLYVNGDTVINGDITYGSYSDISFIPRFELIVRGNIYIAGDVGQLDGLYVAEKDESGNGGNIYTCATDTPAAVAPAAIFGQCQSQLIVNGAFIAHGNIVLNRYANSSLRFVQRTEFPGTLRTCANNIGNMDTCAAEVFNFSPELYLTAPSQRGTVSTPGQKYDAIKSLPPVL
jgi:hypothetical protein